MGKSLFQKVWEAHTVRTLPDGQTQLFIGLHLIHEVTSPAGVRHAARSRPQGGSSRAHVRHASITSFPPTRACARSRTTWPSR